REVLKRFGGLRRSAQARPDVIREMCNLLVCVIATQRRLLQPFQIGQRLLREDNRRWRRLGRRNRRRLLPIRELRREYPTDKSPTKRPRKHAPTVSGKPTPRNRSNPASSFGPRRNR